MNGVLPACIWRNYIFTGAASINLSFHPQGRSGKGEKLVALYRKLFGEITLYGKLFGEITLYS